MTNPTLLPEAALLLEQATALLGSIGLTPEKLGFILTAKQMADDLANPEQWEEGATISELINIWIENAEDDMCDDLFEAAQFLTPSTI